MYVGLKNYEKITSFRGGGVESLCRFMIMGKGSGRWVKDHTKMDDVIYGQPLKTGV